MVGDARGFLDSYFGFLRRVFSQSCFDWQGPENALNSCEDGSAIRSQEPYGQTSRTRKAGYSKGRLLLSGWNRHSLRVKIVSHQRTCVKPRNRGNNGVHPHALDWVNKRRRDE